MQVGDLVFWEDVVFGHHRMWRVRSVSLSASGRESLVQLVSLTEEPGLDTEGKKHLTTWVPEALLRNAAIYRRTPSWQAQQVIGVMGSAPSSPQS